VPDAVHFGRIAVHPQDAANGKSRSRKVTCAAWKKDARYWIGERSGRTASWNVTTALILVMFLFFDQMKTIKRKHV
jgi:hypothetical protein